LQSNTSQYPDSRFSQPTKSLFVEKASIRGGNINQSKFNFILVINDILVEKLRDFQKMSYIETQEIEFKLKNIFKPLPPDWNYSNVYKRESNISMNDIDFDEDKDVEF